MENPTYPAWKHAMLNGVYLAVALIILSLLFYILDLFTESWTGFIAYAVLLAGVVLSSVQYRNKHLGGFISYGQSVSVGFLTGLFAGIIAAVFTFIFMQIVGDEYRQMLLQTAEENMLSKNPDMTDDQLDMAMKFTEKMMHPGWMSLMSFLSNTFFSLIFALLASIFIKKEEKV